MENTFNTEEFEETKPSIVGHLLIRDPESGETFVNQRGDMVQQRPIVGTKDAEGE